MNTHLSQVIDQLNPWLKKPDVPVLSIKNPYIPRAQTEKLLLPDWDDFWMILTGPRCAGKTTLGKFLAHQWLSEKRFEQFCYLNCDFLEIREQLKTPIGLVNLIQELNLISPVIFIDEVQRLENPGLFLKAIIDLDLPYKLLASGSSQLEIKSKIQESLTGRQLASIVLPLSYSELDKTTEDLLITGCYPQIVQASEKNIYLKQLFDDYISKDIIEILKIGKPDVMQKLISLIAHSSGQLVNYNQLATDCHVSSPTIQHYLSILEKTYVLIALTPFVGNKRNEITSNPVYYFLDNGFRNQALKNFSHLSDRTDAGLLVQSAVFQEIYKYQTQNFMDFSINYWRTKSGAEVDFVLSKDDQIILPVEVKYRHMRSPEVTRSFRSFIEAYKPQHGVVITKDYRDKITIDHCEVKFIPLSEIKVLFELISYCLK